MGTLKLPWGGGKKRKYGNEKNHIDKELTNYVISKLKWQCVVTGKKHLSQINTRTLK